MRLFLHLINIDAKAFPQQQLVINTNNNSRPIIFMQINQAVVSSDQLIHLIAKRLKIKPQFFIFRIVIIHLLQYKRIRLLKGLQLQQFLKTITQAQSSVSKYQMQIQLELLQCQQNEYIEDLQSKRMEEIEESKQQQQKQILNEMLPEQMAQMYKYSQQLFETIKFNERLILQNIINTLIYLNKQALIKNLFLLYNPNNGFTLVHVIIQHRHHELLDFIFNNYPHFLNINAKSADGFNSFQFALAIQNHKAIELMIKADRLKLNGNFKTMQGNIISNVIDSNNYKQVITIIGKMSFSYEQIQPTLKMNLYDYVWNKKQFSVDQKKDIIKALHLKHLEMYDYYRRDLLLYFQCQKYIPDIPKECILQRQFFYSPNLKVISGDIIKCRTPPHFSKKVFLSVNSYIGALEQYDINSKLMLNNDTQKLDKYKKSRHISFEQIEKVEVLKQTERSWYMKKELFYFYFQEKKERTIYGCCYEQICNEWIAEINQAIDAWKTHQSKQYNAKMKKKYISIVDMEMPKQEPKRIFGSHYVQIFTNRLSVCEPLLNYYSNHRTELQIQKEALQQKSKSYATITASTLTNQENNSFSLKYSDFKMLQMLGQGSFGQVFLVQYLKNKKLYALKTLQKKKIILSKQTKFVISQVNILKQIKHPFIITLHFTFQTPNYIYLGLEYCQGKDLAKHMNEQITLSEEDVRFYAAQIILALEYLHRMGIIYRDLKPENVMLSKEGHVLLVDFGLSKKTENNFAKTFCGSPAYISPEMLDKKGVSNETDFFSLGVVIFELLFGEPPFFADNIHQLYENIQKGILKFPVKIKPVVKNLLQSLLQKQPKKRLGSNTINQIKNHPFFESIDWQKLQRKQLNPPKRALLENMSDIQSEQELINMFHSDFDYGESNYRTNRFRNFSFIREEEFL